MRVKITLACTECKQRNYNTKKNKKSVWNKLKDDLFQSLRKVWGDFCWSWARLKEDL